MVVIWYSAAVEAFLLACPRCLNSYDYESEEKAQAAMGLHISCQAQYTVQYT